MCRFDERERPKKHRKRNKGYFKEEESLLVPPVKVIKNMIAEAREIKSKEQPPRKQSREEISAISSIIYQMMQQSKLAQPAVGQAS